MKPKENNIIKPLIEVCNLSLHVPIITPKEQKLLSNPLRLLSNFYFSSTNRTKTTIIKEVSFELRSGQSLGLIGANGAGKSTILRILAGIYRPSSGKLIVNGNAKGLFDISLGMRPEATGLENIYLRGLQMGLNFKKIQSLIPEVIEFSELDHHIKNPLATYSTGMRLRLSIAISTMIKPDILLLDEWIGAGDDNFNKKIKERMMSLIKNSRGFVITTHNKNLMKSLCTHGLVLDKGSCVFYGYVNEAIEYYSKMIKPNHSPLL